MMLAIQIFGYTLAAFAFALLVAFAIVFMLNLRSIM